MEIRRKEHQAALIQHIRSLTLPIYIEPFGIQLFPCLFSYVKSIPDSILIDFSKCPPFFLERIAYLKEKKKILMNPFSILNNPSFESEYNLLRTWFEKERRCLYAFKKLVSIWIYKKYKDRQLNTEDPITMTIPRVPIYIFDVSQRGMYVFEAYCLKKHMETELFYSEWMFPEPNHPKNPLTNLEFTESQRIAILTALRRNNLCSWVCEAYRSLQWDMEMLKDQFQIPLKLQALRNLVRTPYSEETIELVQEYILDEYAYHKLARSSAHINIRILKWAVQHMYTCSYIQKWTALFEDSYKSSILFGEYDHTEDHKIEIYRYHMRSKELFYDTVSYETIKTAYLRQNPPIQPRINIMENPILQPLPLPPIEVERPYVLPSAAHRLQMTVPSLEEIDLDDSNRDTVSSDVARIQYQGDTTFIQQENRIIVSLPNGDLRIIYTLPHDMYRLSIGNPSSRIEDGPNTQV